MDHPPIPPDLSTDLITMTTDPLGQVLLLIDEDAERAYIETVPTGSTTEGVRFIVERARLHGYEPMPEDECPSEELPDGSIRTWLAKVAE